MESRKENCKQKNISSPLKTLTLRNVPIPQKENVFISKCLKGHLYGATVISNLIFYVSTATAQAENYFQLSQHTYGLKINKKKKPFIIIKSKIYTQTLYNIHTTTVYISIRINTVS